MDNLQQLIEGYLASEGFNLLDVKPGFVVADRPTVGGARDTRLVWVPTEPDHAANFPQLERRLLSQFNAVIPQYPNASYSIVTSWLGGFSRDFTSETSRLRVRRNPPVQFFDAPFKFEDAPEAASAIKSLRDAGMRWRRVPQPYSELVDGEARGAGDDLLDALLDELRTPGARKDPRLIIVVGPAGAGKSVLFETLFSLLYEQFLNHKARLEDFPRPIPLVPAYLREAIAFRMDALVENFLRTDVAAPIRRPTFEWMLTHGFLIWLFDGLDELYAGDPDFFEDILDLLTRAESTAQILLCARDSLLTTCEGFVEFLAQYGPPHSNVVAVYKLEDWDYSSKQVYANLHFDEPKASAFLAAITGPKSSRFLSGLPYYCDLLRQEFAAGKLPAGPIDEFQLIDLAITGIIDREIDKQLLDPQHFVPEELQEWLETIAFESYETSFAGLAKAEIEEYAQLVLHSHLPVEERDNAITTLLQFPLFTSGAQPGTVVFKHELIAEYLAARYLLDRVTTDSAWVARSLGERADFAKSLLARYMARNLPKHEGRLDTVVAALRSGELTGRAFSNMLQIVLLANPARDALSDIGAMDTRDLNHVRFGARDLRSISFRNCDLSYADLRGCDLQDGRFEGAQLSGTRFDPVSEAKMLGARFGNLQHFESVYVGTRRIDDLAKAVEWVQSATGRAEKVLHPCPAALQLRTLFLKFVHPNGEPKAHDLKDSALLRGKRHHAAPTPEECVDASYRFGYLERDTHPKRTRRAPGEQYRDMVHFARDWQLSTDLRQLLNSLCPKVGCDHVPKLQ